MRYSDIIPEAVTMQPLALRPDQVESAIGGEGMLRMAKQAKWLKPSVEGKRITLYDRKDVVHFWERLKVEGYEQLRKEALKYRSTRHGLKSAAG